MFSKNQYLFIQLLEYFKIWKIDFLFKVYDILTTLSWKLTKMFILELKQWSLWVLWPTNFIKIYCKEENKSSWAMFPVSFLTNPRTFEFNILSPSKRMVLFDDSWNFINFIKFSDFGFLKRQKTHFQIETNLKVRYLVDSLIFSFVIQGL